MPEKEKDFRIKYNMFNEKWREVIIASAETAYAPFLQQGYDINATGTYLFQLPQMATNHLDLLGELKEAAEVSVECHWPVWVGPAFGTHFCPSIAVS